MKCKKTINQKDLDFPIKDIKVIDKVDVFEDHIIIYFDVKDGKKNI